MKTSLKQALKLFSIPEAISLLFILTSRKVGIGFNFKNALFAELMSYVDIIDNGVKMQVHDGATLKAIANINSKNVAFLLRRGSSDLKVFKSIIVEEEYKSALEGLPRKEGQKLHVIDAGANIGVTSIFFASYREGVNIVAIEPDESNFKMLEQNIKLNDLTNITPVKCALWTKNSDLKVVDSFRDGENWSLSVEEVATASTDTIKGITLKDVMKIGSMNSVNLLKVDIEGGERYLFHSEDFLEILNRSVDSLVIEIHDEYNIREKIYSEMSAGNFLMENDTHVTFFRKKG